MEIHLRPFQEKDWDNYLSWHTQYTKWARFDSPWEPLETDIEVLKKDFIRYIEISRRPTPGRLAICIDNDRVIGSVNSYFIDGIPSKRAVGIGICEDSYWGMGIGERALRSWIDFWLGEQRLDTLYCQTWSGNMPMMKLAEKLGFVELERSKNSREIEGKKYDNITFITSL